MLPEDTTIALCDRCGFVFARSAATASNYIAYYSTATKYESNVNASGSGEYALDQNRIAELVNDLTNGLDTNTRILDIGAAKGGVLLELKQRGYVHLYGIDPSRACVDAIQGHGIERDDFGVDQPSQFHTHARLARRRRTCQKPAVKSRSGHWDLRFRIWD